MTPYSSEITIGYKDKKESNWFQTYQSPSELESFLQARGEKNNWIEDKEIFFGRYDREIFDDNSLFVSGERSSGNYYIYFGRPPFYNVYMTDNLAIFLRWGVRLRKFVDRIGRERLLELFRKREGL